MPWRYAAAGAFTAAQALATAGQALPVSIYTARGPVSQSVVIGVPKSATATKVVTVRVKGKVVKRKVSFTYQTVTPMMTAGTSTACDTAYQQLTIPPGGYTGWHTHGPYLRGSSARRGHSLPRDVGLPVGQVRDRGRLRAALDRGHNMRNEASTPLVLWAFYALPPGTSNAAIRIDQPQPADCPNIPYS